MKCEQHMAMAEEILGTCADEIEYDELTKIAAQVKAKAKDDYRIAYEKSHRLDHECPWHLLRSPLLAMVIMWAACAVAALAVDVWWKAVVVLCMTLPLVMFGALMVTSGAIKEFTIACAESFDASVESWRLGNKIDTVTKEAIRKEVWAEYHGEDNDE